LAGDIHDTVAQGLSSVVMLVEAADAMLDRDPVAARGHLALAARTARENLDEARAIVGALTPSPLADATLADALRRLSQRFASEHSTAVAVRVGGDDRPLPTSIEVVLLRVAQEALTNARKHAQASTVDLELTYASGGVCLEVTDDGGGFDVAALSPGTVSVRWRARVEQVGGRLIITSGPDRGTTVRAEVSHMITVMIVDDHPIVRAGLIGILSGEEDLRVVGEASSADEAVTAARTLQPDVVLMDLRMPAATGSSPPRRAHGGPSGARRRPDDVRE
jgi:signal transduction histidine kinase